MRAAGPLPAAVVPDYSPHMRSRAARQHVPRLVDRLRH